MARLKATTSTPSPSPSPPPSPPLVLSDADRLNLLATHAPIRPSDLDAATGAKGQGKGKGKDKGGLVVLSPEDLEKLSRQQERGAGDRNDGEEEELDMNEEEEKLPFWEEVANAALFTIPFGFLYAGMDYAVHAQFGVDLATRTEVSRLLNAVPTLFIFTLLLSRLPAFATQLVLLAICIGCGSSLVHLTGTQSYLLVMKQAPGLGMMWVWSIVRLDLAWAVLGLGGVGGVVWWRGELGTIWGR